MHLHLAGPYGWNCPTGQLTRHLLPRADRAELPQGGQTQKQGSDAAAEWSLRRIRGFWAASQLKTAAASLRPKMDKSIPEGLGPAFEPHGGSGQQASDIRLVSPTSRVGIVADLPGSFSSIFIRTFPATPISRPVFLWRMQGASHSVPRTVEAVLPEHLRCARSIIFFQLRPKIHKSRSGMTNAQRRVTDTQHTHNESSRIDNRVEAIIRSNLRGDLRHDCDGFRRASNDTPSSEISVCSFRYFRPRIPTLHSSGSNTLPSCSLRLGCDEMTAVYPYSVILFLPFT